MEGRDGDQDRLLLEIEAVYRRRFGEFARVTAAIIGERGQAADVVQEAFAVAIRKRDLFGGRGSLDAWIWRIVTNTALNWRAAQRRHTVSRDGDSGQRGRVEPDTRGLSELQALVAGLPERQRLAVFLRYYADLDYSTIAETLGIRPSTVASMLNSAHASLRRALDQEVAR